MNERPADVGIVALEIYIPRTYVNQAELEQFDGVSGGKYTVGLGQQNMAVCTDLEDIVSISLNAVHNLVHKYNIPLHSIGRLEVATESPIDKSKSVKSFLMQMFASAGNSDVEGVDNVNACYAGTACLFNSVAWVESSSWDGRYALVVAADIAVYAKGNARPAGGAGAVALLIGPNAPLVLEPGLRASHFAHVYDFYKPSSSSEYPLVDGALSVLCYTAALDTCWHNMRHKYEAKTGQSLRLHSADYICFHSPYNKLVRKSFARLVFNDFQANSSEVMYSDFDQSYATLSAEETTAQLENIAKYFMAKGADLYEEKVSVSAQLNQQVGNMYTASVFGSLISLICNTQPEQLEGKRILMFSYGSGMASSMYWLRVEGSLHHFQKAIALSDRLTARHRLSPSQYDEAMDVRASHCGQSDYTPSSPTHYVWPSAYVLQRVDNQFRRTYCTV